MDNGKLAIRKGLFISASMLAMTLASCSTGSTSASLTSLPDPLHPKLKLAGYTAPEKATAILPSTPRSLVTGSATQVHNPLDLPGGFF